MRRGTILVELVATFLWLGIRESDFVSALSKPFVLSSIEVSAVNVTGGGNELVWDKVR